MFKHVIVRLTMSTVKRNVHFINIFIVAKQYNFDIKLSHILFTSLSEVQLFAQPEKQSVL